MASVERKSLADLVSSLIDGRLRFQVADLASLPRAAVVVEDRYSALFKLDRARPAVVADGLAELQVRCPTGGGCGPRYRRRGAMPTRATRDLSYPSDTIRT